MTNTAINRRSLMIGAGSVFTAAVTPSFAFASPKGKVTIVEFVDYQCPYCKLGYRETMKLVAEDGRVRLVLKDWPVFGPSSVFAARALLASAGHAGHATAVDTLMRSRIRLTKGRVEAVLKEAGMDPAWLAERMRSKKANIDLALARNFRQAADFKLRGTPALIVGGTLYRQALPLAGLRRAVAAARGEPGVAAS